MIYHYTTPRYKHVSPTPNKTCLKDLSRSEVLDNGEVTSSLTTGLSNKADESAFVAAKSPDGVDLKLSYSTTAARPPRQKYALQRVCGGSWRATCCSAPLNHCAL